MTAEWLLFEAGALSKTFNEGRVCPVLLGIRPDEMEGPLSQFQPTVFDESEMLSLAKTLNGELGADSIDNDVLEDSFKKFWPEFEERVDRLSKQRLGAQSVPQVIRAFAKHGFPEPRVGSQVYFEAGFESHGVYETVCSAAQVRLFVFGRKNRKLFDKDHRVFFESLPEKISKGFQFRCLFLSPQSSDHVLSEAHEDPDFKGQLTEAIQRAYRMLHASGIDPDQHCRTYAVHRNVVSLVADDAVLFTRIRLNATGVASRLTKCPFSVVNSTSPTGQELIAEFDELWTRGPKLSESLNQAR
jgi:hypothetical protein